MSNDHKSFRVPAEWEPHGACVMAWPWSHRLWGTQLRGVQQEVAEIARVVARFEPVLLATRPGEAAHARRLCGTTVKVLEIDFDDVWTRDTGPVFAVNGRCDALLGLNLIFNGWGRKVAVAHWRRDATFAARLCERLNIPRRRVGLVAEGGAVITDGDGTLITTEECLLHPNRNPGLDRLAAEQMLTAAYGASTVIWLPYGWFGDFTDGHVDGVAAFLAPGKVLLQRAPATSTPDAARFARNREVLAGSVDARGRRLEVIEIFECARVRVAGDTVLLSYVNFYLANGAAVVPIAGQPQDARALGLLRELFPDREVLGVLTPNLAWNGGGVHCITQPIPRTGAR